MKKRQGKRASTKRRKKPKPTLPAVGKTFGKTNLPEISKKMYSRLSQILGIPIKELTPKLTQDLHTSGYLHPSHRIGVILQKPSKTVDHELIHSVQFLLEKVLRAEYRRGIKNTKLYTKTDFFTEIGQAIISLYSKDAASLIKFWEPSANVNRPQISQPLIQAFSQPKIVPALIFSAFLTPFFGLKAIPMAFLVSAPNIYRGMATRHYYKKHGADGLILLFADPPKELDLLHLRAREKEFVEKGYLKKKGGFTRKGIQYLRRIMPRGLVLERLQDWKRSREKRKAVRKE